MCNNIFVSYISDPPSTPIFVVNESKVNRSINYISGNNVTILCKSDSYPLPTYIWNSSTTSGYIGQYLNLTKVVRSETWQCTATNNMTLPDDAIISRQGSAKLTIHLLCTKFIVFNFLLILLPNITVSIPMSNILMKCIVNEWPFV